MGYIKNFDQLALTPQRKIVLQLIETAFTAIAPENIMQEQFRLTDSILSLKEKAYDLSLYERIFLVGVGKGSSGIAQYIENTLGDWLTNGWDIDVVDKDFQKIQYTKGTHPLPSQTNIIFTETVLSSLQNLTEKDLVLVVICGGGSALFEAPIIPLPRLEAVDKELLKSGATIQEMNVIRKHLSKVKGGGLAKYLYPAKIVGMLFSDVPGNDMAVIASGPTVWDNTSLQDAQQIVEKYQLQSASKNDFRKEPLEKKYFSSVDNLLIVSNKTALTAMQKKAKELGYHAIILSDRLQGDAKKIGKVLVAETREKEILLAGGETTVHVAGKGIGGRNQALVLATLPFLENQDMIAAFDSDGWDFTTFAGAIGDMQTKKRASSLDLDRQSFLDNDDSTTFFQKTGDGIETGKLDSNVSDLFIVAKI